MKFPAKDPSPAHPLDDSSLTSSSSRRKSAPWQRSSGRSATSGFASIGIAGDSRSSTAGDSSVNYIEDVWHDYQIHFDDLLKSLLRCIDAVSQVSGGEREATMARAQARGREIEELLQEMQTEVRARPFRESSSRSLVNAQLRDCQSRARVARREMNVEIHRHRFAGMSAVQRRERERLLHHDGIYDDIRTSAAESQMLIAEIGEVATRTSSSLHGQGQQLDDIKSDLIEANSTHDRAAAMLRSLRTRMYTDRALQTVIVLMEVAILALVIYIRFLK
jgi:hypothetical protein